MDIAIIEKRLLQSTGCDNREMMFHATVKNEAKIDISEQLGRDRIEKGCSMKAVLLGKPVINNHRAIMEMAVRMNILT